MKKSELKIVYEILNVEEKTNWQTETLREAQREKTKRLKIDKQKNIRQKIRTKKEKEKSTPREEKKKRKKMDNLSKED